MLNMPIRYEQLGRNICAIRKKRKLTQRALAEQLGCSTEHLCHIEKGDRHMQLDMVDRFCERMEVSYQDVLQQSTSVPVGNVERNEDDEAWWKAEFEGIVVGCSDRKIRELLEICRRIAYLSRL